MKMEIKQPPFNTTMMGVVRGVADWFGLDSATPCLYGRSGHAFLINIHEAICPSGPYCWKYDPFIKLLENCGIRMKGHGFYSGESTAEERAAVEAVLKAELEAGHPCSMLNLDNQLITGFDLEGFDCIQPWECDFPPPRLSFGSWKELKDEIHVCFYSFEKMELADTSYAIQSSLIYALDLFENPDSHTEAPYSTGLRAWDTWIEGVKKGYGKEHGNWWNGQVWGECRKMASEYCQNIVRGYPGCSDTAGELAALYSDVSDLLLRVSDKEMEDGPRIELLRDVRGKEERTVPLLRELVELIEA